LFLRHYVRDLNPEKLIFSDEGTHPVLKLADFHFAVNLSTVNQSNPLTGRVGRLGYMAPEMIKSSSGTSNTGLSGAVGSSHDVVYGKPVDIWSVGIITYILLSGNSPFGEYPDKQKLAKAIVEGEYEFLPLKIWKNVSEEGKDFITRLLEVNANKRYSIDQCLSHHWMKSFEIEEEERQRKERNLKANENEQLSKEETNQESSVDVDVASIDNQTKNLKINKTADLGHSSKESSENHYSSVVIVLHGLRGFTALKKFRKIIRVVILIERIKKLVILRKENEEKRIRLGLPVPPPVVTKQPV
jgi:serine/threonine protein kinase